MYGYFVFVGIIVNPVCLIYCNFTGCSRLQTASTTVWLTEMVRLLKQLRIWKYAFNRAKSQVMGNQLKTGSSWGTLGSSLLLPLGFWPSLFSNYSNRILTNFNSSPESLCLIILRNFQGNDASCCCGPAWCLLPTLGYCGAQDGLHRTNLDPWIIMTLGPIDYICVWITRLHISLDL